MRQGLRDLHAVGITEHVVENGHAAHAGQLDAPGIATDCDRRWQSVRRPARSASGPLSRRSRRSGRWPNAHAGSGCPAACPTCLWAGTGCRSRRTRAGFEVDLFDGVVGCSTRPWITGVQRRLGGRGPQAIRDQDPLSHLVRHAVPTRLSSWVARRENSRPGPSVVPNACRRHLAGRQHSRAGGWATARQPHQGHRPSWSTIHIARRSDARNSVSTYSWPMILEDEEVAGMSPRWSRPWQLAGYSVT